LLLEADIPELTRDLLCREPPETVATLVPVMRDVADNTILAPAPFRGREPPTVVEACSGASRGHYGGSPEEAKLEVKWDDGDSALNASLSPGCSPTIPYNQMGQVDQREQHRKRPRIDDPYQAFSDSQLAGPQTQKGVQEIL